MSWLIIGLYLTFISKILEKVVEEYINSFIEENHIMEEFQSGFRTVSKLLYENN